MEKDLSSLEVSSYPHGKLSFAAGVLKRLRIPEIIDQMVCSTEGRPPDIPYGVVALLLLINICDDHHPLYLLEEYFEGKDLEVLCGLSIEVNQLNDCRFGQLLDQLYSAGPRRVFTEIAAYAFTTYGLSIKSLNYDTTSKVMWGEYENTDGKVGVISINFGHSKDARADKKQIKLGIGTADGAIIDAKVLSGNHDDKTYNNEALDDVEAVLKRFDVNKADFYYIADSSLFTEKNIKKAQKKNLNFITRVPETVKLTKQLITDAWEQSEEYCPVVTYNAHNKPIEYAIQEHFAKYKGVHCRFTVCYSKSLEHKKQKTMTKYAAKELETVEKLNKQYKKRSFVCEADANKEIDLLREKKLNKLKYHTVSYNIIGEEKRKQGRPKTSQVNSEKQYTYRLEVTATADEEKKLAQLKRDATFVLASNDLSLSGENMLKEYKTQSSVEKKFQQLKSPHFVNSLYLEKPERIEALTYLILIAITALSVIEKVVRREMKQGNEKIIGPGKVKMTQPTLRSIVAIFNNASVVKICYQGTTIRRLNKPLNISQQKILNFLGLTEDIFTDTG